MSGLNHLLWGGEFIVKDNGEGMSSDIQKNTFEPFYSSFGGGCASPDMVIVKNIIEAHEGELYIYYQFTSERH